LRVPPQCEAICFTHWYGVSIACAQPTAKWFSASGVPNLSIRDAMNSGVSIAAAPLSGIIQLNVPFGPPSPEPPLSPVM